MHDLLNEYIESHVSEEPRLLHELYRYTNVHHINGRMCSGNVQGRLLKLLTAMAAPKRVLELGTFTGYSALCIAEALADDARLHTVEVDDEWADDLRSWFARSPHGGKIILHIGDALELVPQIGDGPWDLVFMDANKRSYTEYFEMVLPLMSKGGFIIADNTLWNGKVAETPMPGDAQTRGIAAFNDLVARDPRVETAIIPVRDGLTLIRKL